MRSIYKLLFACTIVIFMFYFSLFCGAAESESNTYKPLMIQNVSHEIAVLARSIGLAEDDPIIVRAKELWQEANEVFCEDRDIIATVVYNEAGYNCSDRHMELVAAVIYNRMNFYRFPDSVYEVVVAPNQYHPGYAREDSYYGKRARESDLWTKCQDIAAKALKGEIECPKNVFFQANFIQGSSVYEIHYTNYSTTWFCYGE